MNILEETPYTFNLQVTGLSMRQIKDILEDKWGALMWANNCAYPTGDVTLKFTNVPVKEIITMIKTNAAAPQNEQDKGSVRVEYRTIRGVSVPSRIVENNPSDCQPAAYLATPPEPSFGPWVFESRKDALKWATADCVQALGVV